MLRPDFPEIFEFLTTRSAGYSLNTNGTLITREIAKLMRRRGAKYIALYGATKETYDRITRHPGGFEMLMQGFRYLQEAGAGFIVQLIPMRANQHEWGQMKELARSISPHWRIGATWLYLSSSRDPAQNAEIASQRLPPNDVVKLDVPDMSFEEGLPLSSSQAECDDRLFAPCISSRRDFHVDPYGGMSFCSLIKDPAMRYDLRAGTVRECWETFIPSLMDRVHGGGEYDAHCASCELRRDCRWCPVYGWLEHGRFSAPVQYLCEIAREEKRFREEWKAGHRRYFEIAGITIQVDSDLPMTDATFSRAVNLFRTEGPGKDMVAIRHHFEIPDLQATDLGRELYRKPPWAIYRHHDSYYYLGISPDADDLSLRCVGIFNDNHTRGRIFSIHGDAWRRGGLHSLTLFSSDQILIARLLADRAGFYLHAAGAVLKGAGMLFVGHSDAGKSTLANLLKNAIGLSEQPGLKCEILCDDRNIVRRMDDGWRVYGTWSHGDVPDVSPASAPLRAICFIEKSDENSLKLLANHREITLRLIDCLIRPFVTADWWNKTLDLVELMAHEVPSYVMRFDRSGAILTQLLRMAECPFQAEKGS